MKRKHIVIICMAAAALCAREAVARTVVVDASDMQPLAGASVFDNSGTLVTITDADGAFGAVDLPATVRCLGYEAAVTGPSAPDTLALRTASYELGEMTLNLAERDVLRLVCYVRAYTGLTTDADTMASYVDYMVDYMLPVRPLKKYKGRGTPRVLARRGAARLTDAQGRDSICADNRELNDMWLQLATLPMPDDNGEYKRIPDSLQGRTAIDTVFGKHGPAVVRKVSPDLYQVTVDALADKKDHHFAPWFFKLIGFSIDLTDILSSAAYVPEAGGVLKPENLVMRTFTMKAVASGKFFRKALKSATPALMRTYYEIYPADREYLTVAEAKEADKDKAPTSDFIIPSAAAPLDPATLRMLEHAEVVE